VVALNCCDAYVFICVCEVGILMVMFLFDCHVDCVECDFVLAIWFEECGVEFVVFVGYMHLLTKPFLDCFLECIVNVYLFFLFVFFGVYLIVDVFVVGVDMIGVIVYYVDEGFDMGVVIV